jgi:predicted RNase H-like HicB family nuclease
MNDFMYIPLSGRRVTSPLTVRVVIEPEGQGWLAYSPELRPYGASTWCTTREAAIRHIHELIEDIASELRAHGAPISDEVIISIAP